MAIFALVHQVFDGGNHAVVLFLRFDGLDHNGGRQRNAHDFQIPFTDSAGQMKRSAGTLKNTASRFASALLIARFPLITSDTYPLE